MKITFKHRSNLYLNCNRTSSVYRCNNVNCQLLTANVCIITKPTVTNSHRPVHTYRKLPEFAIKLQRQKLFKRVMRFLRLLSMMAPALNSLSTGALDGIVELKRKKTDLTAGCLLSM